MPVGRVKWFDAERGFGFVSNPGQHDCFVRRSVLPAGVNTLDPGQRVEYDCAPPRSKRQKSPEVLRLTIIEEPGRRKVHKHSTEELQSMISDVMTILEQKVQPGLLHGRYPESKVARQVASILRAVADELD